MQTILIFGGFGFLGSNIIDYALINFADEYNFIVFDIYDQHPLGKKFSNVIKTYKGDFTNKEDVKIVFEENKIDYVFHFISTTIPATSNNNIRYDIESNLISTINLLDICRLVNIKSIFFISSGGAVYGDSTQYVHKENDSLNPNSSYGIIKITIEKYLKLYNHLYGLNYLCLRLSNPYGAFHLSKKQGLINIAIKKAINNESFDVWGDGSNLKDYIYAGDVAKIFFVFLRKSVLNQVLNVGTGKGYSINDILNIIGKMAPSFKINYCEYKSFDVPKVILDTESIREYIDFELTPLEVGIKKTYQWTLEQKGFF